tara:strand:+ start:1216 stop:1665 length:450 start_codon:yes stop_codon:yes gene_type:complete
MTRIVKTDNTNQDFKNLVKELDAYLKVTDGDEHDFYNQFNSLEKIKKVVVAYKEGIPIGCGAFRKVDDSSVEIKRMYVKPNERGSGVAKEILNFLEIWAKENKFQKCILETGDRQVEAIRFYQKLGYYRIQNYGQYTEMENSLCFEKTI